MSATDLGVVDEGGLDPDTFLAELDELVGEFIEDVVGGDYE